MAGIDLRAGGGCLVIRVVFVVVGRFLFAVHSKRNPHIHTQFRCMFRSLMLKRLVTCFQNLVLRHHS